MKLAATLYTGLKAVGNEVFYLWIYRRRIYENGTELIDSIESIYPDRFAFNYKSDDIIENMNRNTKIITEDIWQEYCDKLTKYLKENNIINSKTNK